MKLSLHLILISVFKVSGITFIWSFLYLIVWNKIAVFVSTLDLKQTIVLSPARDFTPEFTYKFLLVCCLIGFTSILLKDLIFALSKKKTFTCPEFKGVEFATIRSKGLSYLVLLLFFDLISYFLIVLSFVLFIKVAVIYETIEPKDMEAMLLYSSSFLLLWWLIRQVRIKLNDIVFGLICDAISVHDLKT